jgi:quercetin dioxygenase-like cupin family protein
MKRVIGALAALGAFAALAATPALAQERAGAHEGHAVPSHISLEADELEWKSGPPALPAGAQIALLEGDPSQEGPFTFRLQLPAGFKIAPHTHTGVEHVTILSGRAGIGLGEVWVGETIEYKGAGGYHVMQPGVAHFVMVEEDSIVQVHSVGPWVLTYVNPADDPRNQPAPSAEATTVKSSKSNSSE